VVTLTLPTRKVVSSTPRTRIITVALGSHPFTFHAGQAVFAGLADSAVKRPYSIACSPGQAGRARALDLLVQIDDHRAPDPHLERAAEGTMLRVEGPFGSFGLVAPPAEAHVLLIAGGTGIAPLRSIMWDVLERGWQKQLALIYSTRAPEEFSFHDELATLAAERRIALHLTVKRASRDGWPGARGRIDGRLIAAALKTTETRCLVCGPAAFVTDVTRLLREAGVNEARIVTETYKE
jgi:ferredoxin-NADP reductase